MFTGIALVAARKFEMNPQKLRCSLIIGTLADGITAIVLLSISGLVLSGAMPISSSINGYYFMAGWGAFSAIVPLATALFFTGMYYKSKSP